MGYAVSKHGFPDHVRAREREMLRATAAIVFGAIAPVRDAVVGRCGALVAP